MSKRSIWFYIRYEMIWFDDVIWYDMMIHVFTSLRCHWQANQPGSLHCPYQRCRLRLPAVSLRCTVVRITGKQATCIYRLPVFGKGWSERERRRVLLICEAASPSIVPETTFRRYLAHWNGIVALSLFGLIRDNLDCFCLSSAVLSRWNSKRHWLQESFLLPDDHPAVIRNLRHLRAERDERLARQKELEEQAEADGRAEKSPSWIGLHMSVAEKRN